MAVETGLGVPTGQFLNGEFVNGEGAVDEIIAPATGERIMEMAGASEGQVDRAVQSAVNAFDGWSRLTPSERSRYLQRLADAMEDHAEELTRLECIDCGKPYHLAIDDDTWAAVDGFRFFAGALRTMQAQATGEYLPGHTTMTRRDPVGVVAGIIPWNYPIMMFAYKVAPAIAAGNTIVLKPSELTPLTALKMGEFMSEILPRGVVNLVFGHGDTVGAQLARHPDVSMVCLTGSIASGQKVMEAAIPTVKRTHLELGGKAAVIILDDADLDVAAHGVSTYGYYNGGQDCTAASRVYAGAKIYDDLVSRLTKSVASVRYGREDDAENDMAPLISAAQQHRVASFVDRAAALEHIEVLTGGSAAERPGFYFEPTLIANAHQEDEIVREEVFGPVVSVTPFSDLDDAVALANDSKYGLAASVWSTSVSNVMSIVPRLRAGTVWVNHHLIGATEGAHVAMKMSGTGVDLSTAALESFTVPRNIQIRHSQEVPTRLPTEL